MTLDFGTLGKEIGTALQSIGTYSAKAAAQANAISSASQTAQGTFNQQSADTANALNQNAMASQWAFNSGQATAANLNQMGMWQTAADWNEEMWQKQADFNAEQAQIQREWQEKMANTSYQRAVADMSKAGLNPILAVTGGGVNANVPSGAVASVGGSQMSSAQAQMASGGLLGANSASEGNFMGQMEQMSSTLALLGAVFSGLSSAADAAGNLGETGEGIMQGVQKMLDDPLGTIYKEGKTFWENASESLINDLEKAGKWIKNKVTGEKEYVVDQYSYNNLVKKNQRRHNTGIPSMDRPKG